jgi:hypothetical protein
VEKINLLLSVLTTRKIDNGHCVKYNSQYYMPVDANGHPVYYRSKTVALVIKTLNNELLVSIENRVCRLEAVLRNAPVSKIFDSPELQKPPRKQYIPPQSHPWRQASFDSYKSKMSHSLEYAI